MEETGFWELRNNCLLPLLPSGWVVFVKCFTEWTATRFLDLTLYKVFYPSSIYKATLKFFGIWSLTMTLTPDTQEGQLPQVETVKRKLCSLWTDVKCGGGWLWVANIQVQTKFLSTGSVCLLFSYCLASSSSEKDLKIQRMEFLSLPWSCSLNL